MAYSCVGDLSPSCASALSEEACTPFYDSGERCTWNGEVCEVTTNCPAFTDQGDCEYMAGADGCSWVEETVAVDYSASTTEAITATAGNVIRTFYDSLALIVAIIGTILIVRFGIGRISGVFSKKI